MLDSLLSVRSTECDFPSPVELTNSRHPEALRRDEFKRKGGRKQHITIFLHCNLALVRLLSGQTRHRAELFLPLARLVILFNTPVSVDRMRCRHLVLTLLALNRADGECFEDRGCAGTAICRWEGRKVVVVVFVFESPGVNLTSLFQGRDIRVRPQESPHRSSQ
jgi:hypothetical protein